MNGNMHIQNMIDILVMISYTYNLNQSLTQKNKELKYERWVKEIFEWS